MSEIEILQQKIEKLENILNNLVYSDRYIFQKNIEFNEERNLTFGHAIGTKIGTDTNQKISVFGVTPVIQASSINAPTASGAIYSQSEASSAVAAINSIRTALKNFGITA